MQLYRYQWKLGSILLGGYARPWRCSALRGQLVFQHFPRRKASYSHHKSSNANQKPANKTAACESLAQPLPERSWSPKLPLQIRQEVWKINDPARESWVSSPHALRQYLQCTNARQRAEYWASIRKRVVWTDLPIMLVQFMHGTEEGQPEDKILDDRCTTKLRVLGFNSDDIAHWAWILSTGNPDEVARRLVSTEKEPPMFLLFLVLRGEIQKVRTLNLLMVYVWDRIMVLRRPTSPNHNSAESLFSKSSENRSDFQRHGLDDGGFNLLISSLLYHTRRLWPSAMPTVANLIQPYLLSKAAPEISLNQRIVNQKIHARICNMNNRFLRLFALPASIEPLKSMAHNWAAQRVLLQCAGQFQPALILDKGSYEAVIQVLTALKKSNREAKAASLRARSWPPWRIDQDGMDAERSLDDDQSRAASAIKNSKEAGYRANLYDKTMSIFAGQETDGTPTIQTRKQFKARNANRQPHSDLDPRLWAARIEATRDVGEAWTAFMRFQEKGGKPTQNVYLAMFEKIESESRRMRKPDSAAPAPGDGKEVLSVSDDNFSDFYKQRLQPPARHQLYQQMIQAGFLPQGRCLQHLVRHARTLDEGFNYLRDSAMDKSTLEFLMASPRSKLPPGALARVSSPLFASIIHLLCRFAPRAIYKNELRKLGGNIDGHLDVKLDSRGKEWIVRNPRSRSTRIVNCLHQAAFLLNQGKPMYRPAWYSLFERLASRHLLVSPRWEEFPTNDETCWKVLRAALNEFHACGLELDSHGFLLVCMAFEKYARNRFGTGDERLSDVQDASQILKLEFGKLTEVVEAADILPLFMHSIHGVQLHAYVRCMGLVEDYDEVISTLRWMVKYHEELHKAAERSQNGIRLLRRTLIAIRVFLDGSSHAAKAKELTEEVSDWDGWPSDAEVQLYTANDMEIEDYEGIKNRDEEGSGEGNTPDRKHDYVAQKH